MASWSQAERILGIRLDGMGDVLMTTPALRALAGARPGRRVTLLASPAGAEAARLAPGVDEVIVCEAPWIASTPRTHTPQLDLWMVDVLARRRFEAAVIFTVYSQNPLPAAWLAYLAGIPLRLAHCRENPYQLLTDWVPEVEPHQIVRHEVRRQLDLVAAVGCRTDDERLGLRIRDGVRRAVRRRLQELVDVGGRWAVMHPGASAPSRRYPWEGFAAAARALAAEHGCPVIFTGSAREAPLVERIRRAAGDLPHHSLAGALTLEELGALLELAPVLISNNTGPVHVAAAVGAPVVDLYALTNPQHTPWGVPHRVLAHNVPCKFCYRSVCPEGHHACLRRVPPSRVVEAALAISRVDLRGRDQPQEVARRGFDPASAGKTSPTAGWRRSVNDGRA